MDEIDFSQSDSSDADAARFENFTIGPLTEARLWEGERETMELDRGPCMFTKISDTLLWLICEGSTCQSYMATMGINEIKWANQHAKPRINPRRSLEKPESPSYFISLLERYLQTTPFMAPQTIRTTFSHHDLHLDNIFVNPEYMQITCVIDWQSTSVCEPIFQQLFPRMLQPVQGSAADKPSEEHLKGHANLDYYNTLTKSNNRKWWNDLNIRGRSLMTRPVSTLCGAWQRNDIFSFRNSLIELAARWEEVANDREVCPIRFTTEELEAHKEESEIIEGLSKVLHQLQDEDLLPLGGMIRQEIFQASQKINSHLKEMFIDYAPSEAQKELYSRIWPY